VDKLRTKEYETFRKLDMARDTGDRSAYQKIDEEKKLLKERFKKLGDERVMINNLFATSDGEAEDEDSDEDFYKNEEEPSG